MELAWTCGACRYAIDKPHCCWSRQDDGSYIICKRDEGGEGETSYVYMNFH